MGLTLAIDPAEVDAPGVQFTGTPTGTGFAFDLAVGGATQNHSWAEGAAFVHYVPSPDADDMQATIGGYFDLNGDVGFDGLSFALLGPFIDYYPNPRQGLHLLGSIGLGILAMGDGTLRNSTYVPFQDHAGAGVGVLAGLGYEWRVDDKWSLGALARVTYAAPSGEDDDNAAWQHHLWLPALLVTVTMN